MILYLRQEGRGIGLANKLRAYELQDRQHKDTVEANLLLGFRADHRDYGVGAQILYDLGVRRLRLMTNNMGKYVALRGYGLEIVERVPLEPPADEDNRDYLRDEEDQDGPPAGIGVGEAPACSTTCPSACRAIFRKLRGQARINEAVLDQTLREIRLALLEADVHVGVVQALLDGGARARRWAKRCCKSLTPGPAGREDRARRAGGAARGGRARRRCASRRKPPTVMLLVGLQGSGKTTTTAKLGLWLKKSGRYPYLVPADVYRPAAIEQLVRVGAAGRPRGVRARREPQSPLEMARDGRRSSARRTGSTPCSWTPRAGSTSTRR